MDKIKEREKTMNLIRRIKTLNLFKLPASIIARLVKVDIETVNCILKKC